MSDLRQRVLGLLGRPVPLADLDVVEAESVTGEGVRRCEIGYLVEPAERVRAWLLRPPGKPPASGWPAVVAAHQHAGRYDIGRSEPAGLAGDPMYHYGLELCRRGFVVICPDHLAFEDRRAPAATLARNPDLVGREYELFELTSRVLHGSSLAAKYLFDLTRAVDVLTGLRDVDAERIGVIGHSLGGQEALWLAWYDERVRAGVSSCGFAPIRDILAAGITHNAALYLPGLLQVGDLTDVVASLAPKPFWMLAGAADPIFPVDGVRRLAAAADDAYAAAGAAGRFVAEIAQVGHAFPGGLRERAYTFLEESLLS